MYLLIDNSDNDKTILHFYVNNIWSQRELVNDTGGLLINLMNFLKEEKKQLSDLHGLAVVVGRGRFTATRVAVTLVNTLAYALKIPVLAVDAWHQNLAEDFQSAVIGKYVSALYSAPANIGGKK